MGGLLHIPGPARIAAGSFLAGAGAVGIAWSLTARTPVIPPPAPVPQLIEPGALPERVSVIDPDWQEKLNPPPADRELNQPMADPDATIDLFEEQSGPSPVEAEPNPAPGDRSPFPESPIDSGPNQDPLDGSGEDVAGRDPTSPEPQETETPGTPQSAAQRISINSAGSAELQLLPGIGPVLAQRIIADRLAQGRFRSLKDLQRVSGIGVKTAERLSPLISFE